MHADPPPPIVTEPSGINYATGSALGKGGFAICHRAERYDGSKPTGQLVALKIVKTKMEPQKLAQKVCICLSLDTFRTLTRDIVRNRTSDTLEALASKRRHVLSRLLIPNEHLRRTRTMFQWLAGGYAEEEEIPYIARDPAVCHPNMRRCQIPAPQTHRTPRFEDG